MLYWFNFVKAPHTEKLVAHLAKMNVSIKFGLSRSDFSGNSNVFLKEVNFCKL